MFFKLAGFMALRRAAYTILSDGHRAAPPNSNIKWKEVSLACRDHCGKLSPITRIRYLFNLLLHFL